MRIGKLRKVETETPYGSVRIGSRFRRGKGTYALSLYGPEAALKFIVPSRGFGDAVDKITTELTHPTRPIRLLADLRTFRDEVIAQIEDKILGVGCASDAIRTFGDLIGKYFDNATHLSEKTLKENRYRINVWMKMLGKETPLSEISAQRIRAARDRLLRTPAAGGGGTGKPRQRTKTNVNNCLVTLNTLLNWGFNEGYLRNRDHRHVKKLKVADKEVQWWNKESVCKIIQAARADSPDALLFVSLGLYLGLRRAEIDSVKWRDFDRTHKQWVLKTLGKGQKMRHIPVCGELQTILEEHHGRDSDYVVRPSRTEKGRSDYRFDATKTFARVIEQAGVKRITIHGMRHTFATQCLRSGMSMFKVSRWLGHSSIKVTEETYAHTQAEDDDINMLSFGDS